MKKCCRPGCNEPRGGTNRSYCSNHWREYCNKRERLKKYNLTEEMYEDIMSRTECEICKCSLEGKGKRHIDHDHQTGEFRGVLCNTCNPALGLFKDDVELLKRAIKYLN